MNTADKSLFQTALAVCMMATAIGLESPVAADTFLSGFEGDFTTSIGVPWALMDTDTATAGDQLWTSEFQSTLGVTEGTQALRVNHTADVWQHGLRMDSPTIIPLVANSDTFEFDVTASPDATWRAVWVIMQGDGIGWTQADQVDVQPGQTVHAVIDLTNPIAASTTDNLKAAAQSSGGAWWQIVIAIMGGDAAFPETYTIIDNVKFVGAAPANPADFNGDGDVDGEDLTEWKTGFGSTDAGDADGDLDTDGADFLIWQQQQGASGGGVSAIPEPSTVTSLLAAAMLGCFAARRKHRLS